MHLSSQIPRSGRIASNPVAGRRIAGPSEGWDSRKHEPPLAATDAMDRRRGHFVGVLCVGVDNRSRCRVERPCMWFGQGSRGRRRQAGACGQPWAERELPDRRRRRAPRDARSAHLRREGLRSAGMAVFGGPTAGERKDRQIPGGLSTGRHVARSGSMACLDGVRRRCPADPGPRTGAGARTAAVHPAAL